MIRLAEEKDIEQLLEIEGMSFPDSPWNREQFLYELHSNPFAEIYVYCKEEKILGYMDLWITYEMAQIANVAVTEGARRLGIAQQLMDVCVQKAIQSGCENISLEVRQSNASAIALYVKNGFIKAGVRKKYYPNGEDGDLMIKPIGGLL